MAEEKRIRVNAKQTSKGDWYFDITAETDDVELSTTYIVNTINNLQEKFKAEGFPIVEKKE